MNKIRNYIFTTATVGTLALMLPVMAHAMTAVDVSASTAVGATVNTAPGGVPPVKIQQLIKQKLDTAGKIQVAEENRNFRNDKLSSTTIIKRPAIMASSTKPINPAMMKLASSTRAFASTTRAEIRDDRQEMRTEAKEIRENMREARMDMFKNMKERLVKQSERALENLKQIRARVSERIATAEKTGKDMTEAKKLLVVADEKLRLAAANVTALSNFKPTLNASSTPGTDESASVDLAKPRAIGEAVIRSTNDARKALVDVVVSIAKAMGLKVGMDKDGHITTATSSESR